MLDLMSVIFCIKKDKNISQSAFEEACKAGGVGLIRLLIVLNRNLGSCWLLVIRLEHLSFVCCKKSEGPSYTSSGHVV